MYQQMTPRTLAINIWNKFKERIEEEVEAYLQCDSLPMEDTLWQQVFITTERKSEINLEDTTSVVGLLHGEKFKDEVEDLLGDFVNEQVSIQFRANYRKEVV